MDPAACATYLDGLATRPWTLKDYRNVCRLVAAGLVDGAAADRATQKARDYMRGLHATVLTAMPREMGEIETCIEAFGFVVPPDADAVNLLERKKKAATQFTNKINGLDSRFYDWVSIRALHAEFGDLFPGTTEFVKWARHVENMHAVLTKRVAALRPFDFPEALALRNEIDSFHSYTDRRIDDAPVKSVVDAFKPKPLNFNHGPIECGANLREIKRFRVTQT